METIIFIGFAVLFILMIINRFFYTKTENDNSTNINIKDLTLNVKQQLQELDSLRREKNEEALFKIESFDLEINFVVKKTNSVSAGIEYNIVTIEDNQEFSKEQTQKIVLHMKTNDSAIHDVIPATQQK